MSSNSPEQKPKIIWSPFPGSQRLFLSCPIFEVLLEGTRGGGKTDTLLMDFAREVGKGYGAEWNGVLFRQTYPQLDDVVKKSKKWFPQIFPTAKFNESEYVWKFATGEELKFRYGDREEDYWNYHGHNYPWLAFEELTNWANLSFYQAMQSTCRSAMPGIPKRVRSTCNPFGKGHEAVKSYFKIGEVPQCTIIEPEKPFLIGPDGSKIDLSYRKRTRITSTVWENKLLLENDPSYLASILSIADVNRRKAWLNGDWDIHVGSFLEGVWDASKHIVEPFFIPSGWEMWRSMDWGYSAPYCVLYFAMNPDGVIFVFREIYGKGERDGEGSRENVDQVAQKMKAREASDERNGYEYRYSIADSAIFSNVGTDRSIGKAFADAGIKWRPSTKGPGSRINGAQEIIRLLADGKLKFFRTCKHCIRTIPTLHPDERNPEDVDTTEEDHAWDALRYGVQRKRKAPEEETIWRD